MFEDFMTVSATLLTCRHFQNFLGPFVTFAHSLGECSISWMSFSTFCKTSTITFLVWSCFWFCLPDPSVSSSDSEYISSHFWEGRLLCLWTDAVSETSLGCLLWGCSVQKTTEALVGLLEPTELLVLATPLCNMVVVKSNMLSFCWGSSVETFGEYLNEFPG